MLARSRDIGTCIYHPCTNVHIERVHKYINILSRERLCPIHPLPEGYFKKWMTLEFETKTYKLPYWARIRICAHRKRRPTLASAQIRVFDLRCIDSQGTYVSSCGKLKLLSDCADAQTDFNFCYNHMQSELVLYA